MHRFTTTALLAIACTAPVVIAQDAPRPGRHDLRGLLAGSELAFRGEVVEIRYANSLPAADALDGIPHTFVTYRVDEVLHGQADGEEVTLRFMGGWDPSTQTYLHVSLVPEFDLGDHDILFVRGNGDLGAPLVGNREGRLRVSGGQVYSDTGRAVRINELGRLILGERYDLPEVGSVSALGHTFWIGFDPEAVVGPSDAISAEAFVARVGWAAALTAPPAAPFASVGLDHAFDSPFPAPTVAQEAVAKQPEENDLDAETLAELLADESGLAEQYRKQLETATPAKR